MGVGVLIAAENDGALNRTQDFEMGTAAAQVAGQRLTDLRLARGGIAINRALVVMIMPLRQ